MMFCTSIYPVPKSWQTAHNLAFVPLITVDYVSQVLHLRYKVILLLVPDRRYSNLAFYTGKKVSGALITNSVQKKKIDYQLLLKITISPVSKMAF